jgi:hypothetical protein
MLYITSAEPEESGIKSSYAVIGATKEKGKKKMRGERQVIGPAQAKQTEK